MTIRISDPLVSILLSDPPYANEADPDLNRIVEAAGGRIQAVLVECVSSDMGLMCPACYALQDPAIQRRKVVAEICSDCGEVYVGFWRSFAPQPKRWYSFSPF